MKSLKEWATVIKALENGDQTVILRKGGILEVMSRFQIESKRFLLFPTWEHQEIHHIKPRFYNYLKEVKENPPDSGFNKITSYAEVLAYVDIDNDKIIQMLSDFHIWSDSYIEERRNWKPENPMKAVFLRIFKISDIIIPLKPEYQGCKSWIDINEEIPNGQSVLSDEEINSKLKRFKDIVK